LSHRLYSNKVYVKRLIDCGFEGSLWRFGIDRFNIDEMERWFPSGGDWADEDGE
jgi:hypothetical protein